jgi:hypothetical protein
VLRNHCLRESAVILRVFRGADDGLGRGFMSKWHCGASAVCLSARYLRPAFRRLASNSSSVDWLRFVKLAAAFRGGALCYNFRLRMGPTDARRPSPADQSEPQGLGDFPRLLLLVLRLRVVSRAGAPLRSTATTRQACGNASMAVDPGLRVGII